MTRLLLLTALVFYFDGIARGDTDYCALNVQVNTPTRAAVVNVPVYVVQDGNTIHQTLTDAGGLAKLCDVPLKPFDIFVGFDVCGSVVVRDVRAAWPTVRQVFVTYAKTPCNHFTFDDACNVIIRVQDQGGKPIPGAQFREGPSSNIGRRTEQSQFSDTFGRIFWKLKTGDRIEGVITKDGKQTIRISEQCLERGERDLERKVTFATR